MYLLLSRKAFCMEKLVACIAQVWFWPIPPHKLSSNLEGSGGLFYELCSSFNRFSIGFKSGDWLCHSSSFIFFLWNQLRLSLAVCLGSLSCWNVHPRFIFSILVDGSRFLSRMSRYISPFILPSIIWNLPLPYAEKQPHTMMFHLQTSNLLVFLGWCAVPFLLQTWCVLWHPKSSILVSFDQTIFSQYFIGLSKYCAANLKRASTCFFFSNGVLRGERS